MKEYTREYQLGSNIEWFCLDHDNHVIQFTSGGAILPKFIAKNAQRNIILNEYFESMKPFTAYKVNPFLDKYFDVKTISSINDYVYFAEKGILSFDKTNPSPGNFDITYHLLAKPEIFLDLTALPEEIRTMLLETKQNIRFLDFYKLDAGYIPWASLFEDYIIKPLYEPPVDKKKRFW